MVVQELFAKLGLELDAVGFEKAEHVLHSLHHGFAAFGAAAVGALAIGAAGLAAATANAAVAASRLAQSTGVDLATIQELGFAASTAGVSTDEMAIAMRHLAKTGVKDVRKGMLDLAERFQKMPDDGRKVALAMEKFGRAGARMIPVLNKGKEGIQELMEEAHELGLVFGEEDVAAGKEFKHSLHLIEAVFKGIGYSIGRLVLPLVNKFMKGFAHILIDMRKGAPWVHGLVLAFKVLAFVLGGAVLAALVSNAAAIATAVAGYVTLGAAAAATAVRMAAAWLVAAIPAILLIAAFTALLLILDDVRAYLNGEDSLIGDIGPKWTKFIDAFTKPQADDPWWLAKLREGIGYLTDMEATYSKISSALGFSGATVHGREGRGEVATQAEIDAKQLQMFGGFHGSGSPAANRSTERLSQDAGFNGRPWVQAPVTINVSGAGDPKAVGDQVRRVMEEHHSDKIREASTGIHKL